MKKPEEGTMAAKRMIPKPSSAMEDNRIEIQPDVFNSTTAKSWGTSAETVREPPREHSQQAAPAQRGGGSRPKNRKSFSHRKPHYKARVAVVEDEEENPEPFCFCTGIERGVKAEEWVVDSGATTHMTWDKGVFVTFAA